MSVLRYYTNILLIKNKLDRTVFFCLNDYSKYTHTHNKLFIYIWPYGSIKHLNHRFILLYKMYGFCCYLKMYSIHDLKLNTLIKITLSFR